MEFTIDLDGVKFTAKKEDIDDVIDYIVLTYNLCDDDRTYCTQLVCESNTAIDYIITKLQSALPNFKVYDFKENKTPNFQRSFYGQIENKDNLIAKGMEEYCEYLQVHYYNGNKVSCNFRQIDEAKVRLYYNSINFRRDSAFNANNAKVILVFSNNECTIFNNTAYDFCSQYGETFDFNECFKQINDAKENNLSKYLMNINAHNRCVKEYKLKQEGYK